MEIFQEKNGLLEELENARELFEERVKSSRGISREKKSMIPDLFANRRLWDV